MLYVCTTHVFRESPFKSTKNINKKEAINRDEQVLHDKVTVSEPVWLGASEVGLFHHQGALIRGDGIYE